MSEHADTFAARALGAHAIGALAGDEAKLVEAALTRNAALADEAAQYREVAAWLLNAFHPIEPGLNVWRGIERGLTDRRTKQGRRRGTWMLTAAVVAAVTLLAGAVVLAAGDRSPATDAEVLAAAPGSRTLQLTDPVTGADVASLVIGADGSAFLVGDGLAPLADGATYQLWSVVGGEVVSAGLLGPDPGAVALRVEADPSLIAVTVERAGGVVVSAKEAVASWSASG
jgi:anti-sigma-K factor RskA